jgi:hypothetical protein
MICHTLDTETNAPFHTQVFTNNWPAHNQYDENVGNPDTFIAEGSSSEGSCTDDGTEDELNSADVIFDIVTALSEQGFDDGWVSLKRLTQATMNMCAISQHQMTYATCLDIADDWVQHGVMRYNNDRTKIKFN